MVTPQSQVSITFKEQYGQQLVVCKEKKRGSQAGRGVTTKFKVGQTYQVVVTVRPAKQVKYMWINGPRVDFEQQEMDDNEENVFRYKVMWQTADIAVTKRGTRHRLPIEIEFENGQYVKTSLQAKFYARSDRERSVSGRALLGLELDCVMPQGQNIVEVVSCWYNCITDKDYHEFLPPGFYQILF